MQRPSLLVNPPLADIAAVKPVQLVEAAKLGLRIPDTLITSDMVAAKAFISDHPDGVVHKALNSPPHRLVDTRRWSDGDVEALRDLSVAPTIFQEEIVGTVDIPRQLSETSS